LEIDVRGHCGHGGANQGAEVSIFPVVRGVETVDTVGVEKLLECLLGRFLAGLEHAEGLSASGADEREAGNVGEPVADVDHVLEGDASVGSPLVHEMGLIPRILGPDPLVDLEQEAGLLGEGDTTHHVADHPHVVAAQSAAVEAGEMLLDDRAAGDDRFQPTADDEEFDRQIPVAGDLVPEILEQLG
jgi:hypothetical protein